jgi:tetratricopeptide (TPR) repeat protein
MRRFERLLEAGADVLPIIRARALRCYGGSSSMAGDFDRAQLAYEQSLELFRAAGDDRGVAVLLHRIGTNALNLGTPELARKPLEESLAFFRRVGSERGIAQVLGSLGHIARADGDVDQAISLFEESLAMVRESGFVWWQSGMLGNLAEVALEQGRLDEAEARAREMLSLAEGVADKQHAVYGLAYIAWVAAERGDPTRAGRFWGAIEAEETRGPIGAWTGERDLYASHVLATEGPELERGLEECRQLSLDQAIEEALGENDAR